MLTQVNRAVVLRVAESWIAPTPRLSAEHMARALRHVREIFVLR